MTGLLGTAALVRLAVRRDRLVLPAWIVAVLVTVAASASATIAVYPTALARIQAATSINDTSSLVALYGRIYDPSSLGEVALFKTGTLGVVLVAIMAIFCVVRHSRADEEAGRTELIGAAGVGRYAPLASALVVAFGASVMLGVGVAIALPVVGLPVGGSVAFGASLAGTGMVFAAVAAAGAQLTRSARAANGLAGLALVAAYLLRAVGDTGPGWLTWISPLGWAEQVRPFAGGHWWVVLLMAGCAVVLVATAAVLVGHRDLGAGLLPDRRGRAGASRWLRGPFALALRLQRGVLLIWLAACLLGGLVVGGIAANVGTLTEDPRARSFIEELGGKTGITDAFVAAELGFLGVAVSIYAIQAVLRMRHEETSLRLEPILATPIGRIRWALEHLVVVLLGSAVLLTGAGLTAGLALARQTGDLGEVGAVVAGAAAQIPAVWVLAAITMALFGVVPRLTVLGWAALAGFMVLSELGPVLKLSHWVLDLSPFTHLPKLPGGTVTAPALVWLVVLAGALIAVGVTGFRRRDLD